MVMARSLPCGCPKIGAPEKTIRLELTGGLPFAEVPVYDGRLATASDSEPNAAAMVRSVKPAPAPTPKPVRPRRFGT